MTVVEDIFPLLDTLNKRQKLQVMEFLVAELTLAEAEESSLSASEKLGWSPTYFTETFGAFQNDPLERPDQGTFEIRESLE